MKYCKYFVPLVALACTFGFADTAKAELGACCAPDGSCVDDQSNETCVDGLGGAYLGDGTTCATDDCPDCDCAGGNDVKMIADCKSDCATITCVAVPPGPAYDACIAACEAECTMENLCPDLPYQSGNYCCDPSGGGWTHNAGQTCTVCQADGSWGVDQTSHDFCEAEYPSGECTYVVCEPPTAYQGCVTKNHDGSVTCGDPALDICDLQDTCVGGQCVDHREPITKECRPDDGSGCDVADYCDGHRYCPADVKAAQYTACGDPSDVDCDEPDSCGGGGNAGICMPRFDPATKICRDKDDPECDKREYCTGSDAACPPDLFKSAVTTCGNPNGHSDICDKQDTCDGAGACVNHLWPADTPCRAKNGDCDVADVCDGETDVCADAFEPLGKECRANPNPSPTPPELTCGIAEFCPGDGPDCPPDTWVAAGTVCRPYQTECDAEEVCTGSSSFCPTDVVAAMNMDPCTKDTYQCTNDVCWNNNCVHPNVTEHTPCDDAEICTTLDRCESGVCVGHNWDPCTDSVYCTKDECVAGVGCNNTYNGGPCGDLLVKLVPTGSGPIEDSYQKGCFTVEVFVMDASDDPQGINCAFVNLTLGDANCPLSVMDLGTPIYDEFDFQVEIDPAFPDFNTWWVDPPSWVYDFGGCTNEGDVGIGVWVPLGTVDVIAPNKVCDATISAAQSGYTDSSLIGQGYATAQQQETVSPISMHCWGDLYDNTNLLGFVDAGDLSYFAPCWMDVYPFTPGCEDFDYDMSDSVDPGDLAFFASAWQEYVCAGGVVIPLEQMRCNGYGWGPGGAASVSGNGAMLDEDGNVVVVHVPPASVEMIKSFGLTVPERLVAPPDNDRLTPKDRKRAGVRSR